MKLGAVFISSLVAVMLVGVSATAAEARVGAQLVIHGPRPGVRLVDLRGVPVRGSWQRWADAAEVPTVQGAVIMAPRSVCDIPGVPMAEGCSNWVEPYFLYASDRTALYFELGHIFDRAMLTDRDRATFARMWGDPHAPWLDTAQALSQGREDGLMVDFAAAYEMCARGAGWTGLQSGDAPSIQNHGTCGLIRRIGKRF